MQRYEVSTRVNLVKNDDPAVRSLSFGWMLLGFDCTHLGRGIFDGKLRGNFFGSGLSQKQP
jgi:hypothetical protein